MKITLFGATGATGRLLLQRACEAGHEVTAVVRDPAPVTTAHPRMTVFSADVMDPDAIGPATAGHDVVVSTIGSREGRSPTTVQTDSTMSIVASMRQHGVRRLVVVSSSGLVTDGDGPVSRVVAKPILHRVLKHLWADMRGMEDVVCASGLDWTIIRSPMLTNGRHTGSYRTAVNHNVRGGIRISRANLADCIVGCLGDPGSVHAAISIGN